MSAVLLAAWLFFVASTVLFIIEGWALRKTSQLLREAKRHNERCIQLALEAQGLRKEVRRILDDLQAKTTTVEVTH